ncbi:MAG TPA: hypothetical protein VHB98_07465 [Chloroflexota bacterium]|jgi:hypothetical protein|nr:hypothetical protein [Chloroflexota bacterium]
MKRVEREEDFSGFGVSMPVLFGIWVVCAVIAGIVWQNLVSNTPGALSLSFSSMLILSIGFGFAGAGLICMAIDIIRQP